jgi:hypothetical protein
VSCNASVPAHGDVPAGRRRGGAWGRGRAGGTTDRGGAGRTNTSVFSKSLRLNASELEPRIAAEFCNARSGAGVLQPREISTVACVSDAQLCNVLTKRR